MPDTAAFPSDQPPHAQPPPLIPAPTATPITHVISGLLIIITASIILIGMFTASCVATALTVLTAKPTPAVLTDIQPHRPGQVTLTAQGEFIPGVTRPVDRTFIATQRQPPYKVGETLPLIVSRENARIKALYDIYELEYLAWSAALLLALITFTTIITRQRPIAPHLPRWFTDIWNKIALLTCAAFWVIMMLGMWAAGYH